MAKSGELEKRMLIGQHIVKVGEKNRIAFPKKMREQMGDDLMVSYGFENSVMVFAKDKWEAMIQDIEKKPLLQKNARQVKRFLIGGAMNVVCDTQGRFVLPEYLMEFAKIRDEIVVIGMGKYVEIWNKKTWEDEREKIQKDIESVADTLVERIED